MKLGLRWMLFMPNLCSPKMSDVFWHKIVWFCVVTLLVMKISLVFFFCDQKWNAFYNPYHIERKSICRHFFQRNLRKVINIKESVTSQMQKPCNTWSYFISRVTLNRKLNLNGKGSVKHLHREESRRICKC